LLLPYINANVTASPQRSTRIIAQGSAKVEVLSTGYFSGTNSTNTKHTSCRSYTAMTQTDVWNFVSGFRKHENSKTLQRLIFFSVEACFHLNGTVNRHNLVYWSDENPHVALDAHNQTDPRINVWCGIHGDDIIGPVFLNNRLTGVRYRQHLENTLQPYLIGRRGPRFPDLTPLDFFLWSHLKSVLCGDRPRIIAEHLFRVSSHYPRDVAAGTFQLTSPCSHVSATRWTSVWTLTVTATLLAKPVALLGRPVRGLSCTLLLSLKWVRRSPIRWFARDGGGDTRPLSRVDSCLLHEGEPFRGVYIIVCQATQHTIEF
jgi:hypothetical protein